MLAPDGDGLRSVVADSRTHQLFGRFTGRLLQLTREAMSCLLFEGVAAVAGAEAVLARLAD